MKRRAPSAATVLVLAACSTTAPPPPATSAPPPPTASAPPVAASAAPGPTPTAPTTSCLMTHICGCNLGCTRIAVDPGALREGLHAKAQTGSYAGKDLIVTKETDAAGASVFALSDRVAPYACEREAAESKSLLGFACAAKDSGPVPARACASGCE